MDETVEAVRGDGPPGEPHQHVVVNAAKIVDVERDHALRRVIGQCDLVNADGMAVVWACRILGRPLPERVAGIDLFERLVGAARDDGRSVYFLGARDEVVREAAARAQTAVSRRCGSPVTTTATGTTTHEVVAAMQGRGARLPVPRHPEPAQGVLAQRAPRTTSACPFVMGVGGSFDVVAGRVSRAPAWMQRTGFEWAWRLGQEPRRMWRRYLYTNTAFIRMTIRERWKARR